MASTQTTLSDLKFLLDGLRALYPSYFYPPDIAERQPIVSSYQGIERAEFLRYVLDLTASDNPGEAIKVLLRWQEALESESLSETVPPEITELVEKLEKYQELTVKERKNLAWQISQIREKIQAQKLSLETKKETETPIPEALPVKNLANPLTRFFAQVITTPFRAAVYFSGPKTYLGSAPTEGPAVATARYFLIHGFDSGRILSLQTKAQALGITPKQLKELAQLIKIEEKAHPFISRWLKVAFSARQLGLTQSQIFSLLVPSADGKIVIIPQRALLGGFFRRVGQQLFGRISAGFLKKATASILKKIASASATTAITGAETAAAGAGLAAGPPGWIVAAVLLVKKIGSWLVRTAKGFFTKITRWLTGDESKELRWLALASAFIGGLILIQQGLLLIGSALTATGGVGLLGELVVKVKGLKTQTSSLGESIKIGLMSVVLPAITTPLVIALVATPLIIALIIFIINASAYLVPPASFSLVSENPYIEITKEPSPSGSFKNNDLPLEITYTITIVAKKSTLTNVSFEHKCEILKEGGVMSCPAPMPDEIPTIISPVEPYVFTYTTTYSGGHYQNSLVMNTFTITVLADNQTETSASGASSIIIGNPPTACYKTEGNWPAAELASIMGAIANLRQNYPAFVSKVCAAYPEVKLYFDPPKVCGAWGCAPGGNIIYFNSLGLGNLRNATFILAHESGHVLAYGNPSLYSAYLSFPGTLSELPVCSYGGTSAAEGFAEAIGRYTINAPCLQNEPNNVRFVETHIF